jgi:hypothetical protein
VWHLHKTRLICTKVPVLSCLFIAFDIKIIGNPIQCRASPSWPPVLPLNVWRTVLQLSLVTLTNSDLPCSMSHVHFPLLRSFHSIKVWGPVQHSVIC